MLKSINCFQQEKSQLKQATISDQDRKRLQDELEGKITQCVSDIQYCESRIQTNDRVIANIRRGAEERQRKEGE